MHVGDGDAPFFLWCDDTPMIHFVEEVDVCGLVHNWWMYDVKRMNKVLKWYVWCMKQPKGCMAKGYAMEESMGFLMEYMQDFRLVSRRVWDIKKGVSGEVWRDPANQFTWALLFKTLPIIMSSLKQLQWHGGSSRQLAPTSRCILIVNK
jgi:hypothetical protein